MKRWWKENIQPDSPLETVGYVMKTKKVVSLAWVSREYDLLDLFLSRDLDGSLWHRFCGMSLWFRFPRGLDLSTSASDAFFSAWYPPSAKWVGINGTRPENVGFPPRSFTSLLFADPSPTSFPVVFSTSAMSAFSVSIENCFFAALAMGSSPSSFLFRPCDTDWTSPCDSKGTWSVIPLISGCTTVSWKGTERGSLEVIGCSFTMSGKT